jgi:O-antigen/teichoic acid export membrane protein
MTAGKLILINIIWLHLGLSTLVVLSAMLTLAAIGIRPAPTADPQLGRQMVAYGAKFQVGQFFGSANLTMDQVLIAAWLPPAALGFYVVAVSAATLSQILSRAVQTVATPEIAQRDNPEARIQRLQQVFNGYWGLSILVMIGMAALLPIVIPVVYGAAFRGAIVPAEILLLASLFMGAKHVLSGGAVALGDPWLISKANVAALPVTVGLLLVLLPVWGPMGAALASSAAYSVELGVLIYGLRRRHAISTAGLFRLDLRQVAHAFRFLTSQRRVQPTGLFSE